MVLTTLQYTIIAVKITKVNMKNLLVQWRFFPEDVQVSEACKCLLVWEALSVARQQVF